ncbi:MAG: hypothetical protein ACHRHE_12745, partial [Tepidisphaerales bacterium]
MKLQLLAMLVFPSMVFAGMPAPLSSDKPTVQPSIASALLDRIRNAPANTWIEIPQSPLMAVAPKPDQFPKTWAVCGPGSVVAAWCGAAYD